MNNADKWVHPTKFTGDYPSWNGYTWLQWAKESKSYHPGDDYNFGSGSDDLGQDVVSASDGVVFHVSKSSTGYGDLIIIKHTLGYNLKRLIKEIYGIETDTLYTLYAHLKDIVVKLGDKVKSGDKIAEVGKTGTNSPHLHFEIYSLWKDLKSTTYRFYPVGWSKEKIAENWLPAYKFIEATKQIDSFESFLGKPRAYWEQVEKDRSDLLRQIGEKDAEFAKILAPIELRVKELQNENEQLNKKIAKTDDLIKGLKDQCKKDEDKLNEKLISKDDEIRGLKTRITEILSEQSDKLKAGEALILFIETVKKHWRKDK